jgi:hypothetical protein
LSAIYNKLDKEKLYKWELDNKEEEDGEDKDSSISSLD